MFKVKKKQIIGKSKTNSPADCLEKCKVNIVFLFEIDSHLYNSICFMQNDEPKCVGINWSKKKCFLLKGKLRLKKKKKFTAGKCV